MTDTPTTIRCSYGKGEITIPANADEQTLLKLKQQGADIQGECVGGNGPNIYMCKCAIGRFLNEELPKPSAERT